MIMMMMMTIFRKAYKRVKTKNGNVVFFFLFTRNTPDEMPIHFHLHIQKQTRTSIFFMGVFFQF